MFKCSSEELFELIFNIQILPNITVVTFYFLTSLIILFCIIISRTYPEPSHIWQHHSTCQNKLALWVVEIYFFL